MQNPHFNSLKSFNLMGWKLFLPISQTFKLVFGAQQVRPNHGGHKKDFVCSLVGLIWDFCGTKWGLYHVTLTLEGKKISTFTSSKCLTIFQLHFRFLKFQILHCFGLNYFHVEYKPILQFSHVPILNCLGVEFLGDAICRLVSKVHHCPHFFSPLEAQVYLFSKI